MTLFLLNSNNRDNFLLTISLERRSVVRKTCRDRWWEPRQLFNWIIRRSWISNSVPTDFITIHPFVRGGFRGKFPYLHTEKYNTRKAALIIQQYLVPVYKKVCYRGQFPLVPVILICSDKMQVKQ
jgi:hypothetical protein